MKYTTKDGDVHFYKSETKLVRRTLQMASRTSQYEITDVLDVIWLVAGNLVQEVRAQPIYHRSDGNIVRAFDLFFLTGEKILYGKTAVNRLMAEIESACVETLPNIGLVQCHHLAREIQPNLGFRPRSKMRTEQYSTSKAKVKDQWGRISFKEEG